MTVELDRPVASRRRGRKPDQKKREAIFDAAHRLFMTRGYAASVDAIAVSYAPVCSKARRASSKRNAGEGPLGSSSAAITAS